MTTELIWRTEPEPATHSNQLDSLMRRYIRLGPFQVDREKELVTKDGSRLQVTGKTYQVLLLLLEKPGQTLTRETIRQRLWPSDINANANANTNTTINKLRRALGESRYIETIPGKGYTLNAYPEFSDHPVKSFSLPSFWSIPRIIGLILFGMSLGGGMVALWISYHR